MLKGGTSELTGVLQGLLPLQPYIKANSLLQLAQVEMGCQNRHAIDIHSEWVEALRIVNARAFGAVDEETGATNRLQHLGDRKGVVLVIGKREQHVIVVIWALRQRKSNLGMYVLAILNSLHCLKVLLQACEGLAMPIY